MDDDDQVRAVEAAYDEAWGRGDVEGLLGCLTGDAVIVNPGGDVARGSEQVRAVFEGLFAGWARGSTHTSEVLRVEPVTADVVVLDGRATLTGLGSSAPGSDGGVIVHGYTEVLVHRRGGWLIAHVRAHAGD